MPQIPREVFAGPKPSRIGQIIFIAILLLILAAGIWDQRRGRDQFSVKFIPTPKGAVIDRSN